MAAAPRTSSATSASWGASGLVLRQIMPTVRAGCGSANRARDTSAERVSTSAAISGIRVTPMPAPTICTRVDSELPSRVSRGRAERIWQKDRAWSRKQCPSSSSSSRISRRLAGLGTGSSPASPGRTSRKFSENRATSVKAGSEIGRATMAASILPSDSS